MVSKLYICNRYSSHWDACQVLEREPDIHITDLKHQPGSGSHCKSLHASTNQIVKICCMRAVREQQCPPAGKSPCAGCRPKEEFWGSHWKAWGSRDLCRNHHHPAQGKRHQPCQNPWYIGGTGDTRHLTLPLYKTAARKRAGFLWETKKKVDSRYGL